MCWYKYLASSWQASLNEKESARKTLGSAVEYFRPMKETTKKIYVNFLQCALERWVAETIILLAAYTSDLISRVFPFKYL